MALRLITQQKLVDLKSKQGTLLVSIIQGVKFWIKFIKLCFIEIFGEILDKFWDILKIWESNFKKLRKYYLKRI